MLGLISLGGNCTESIRLRKILQQNYFAVAADSGASHFEKLKIKPELLVGDMDSISEKLFETYQKSGVKIFKYNPRKNLTDSEIAVEKVLEAGCDSILFIGSFGSRFDHMFGNIMLSANLAKRGIPVTLTDGVTFFYSVTQFNSPFEYSLDFENENEDVFSVVPVIGESIKITIKGLEFELDNETVNFGTNRCMSNTIPLKRSKSNDLKPVLISIKDGVAFFIHCKKD